ncbi:MAG TPA: hypothetical protein VGM43_12775 [Bryobacteraceae bacterium]
MKKIQFRAWDTDRKKTLAVTKLFMDGLGVSPRRSMELEHERVYGDLYPLMQFTGLRENPEMLNSSIGQRYSQQ